MKRILTFIAAVMMSVMAVAQTVESSKLYENTYVTVTGGAITTQHLGGQPFFWGGVENIAKGVRPFAGLELGKYVTPVVGFSVEGLAMFNTTGSNTIVDQSNVVGNLKFNLSNLFGGYKGQPRRVEVVLVPGLGWGHDYGDVYHDRNYLTYNAGAELNINLGEKRAWQINVKPVVMWNNYNNALRPVRSNMQARLQFGITYKFGSKSKKSHNFVLCPYSVTASDYEYVVNKNKELEYDVDELQNKVKELESRKPEVVEKTVVVEKLVRREPALTTVITFPVGSAKLSKAELAKLRVLGKVIASDENIRIVGSADSATGSAKFNEKLSANRAEVVKDVLVKEFGIAPERISVSNALDATEYQVTSRSAVITLL